MKRYLITITGRANLGYKGNRLRERDLCYSYVYGKNKAEAISKFWEQIEKSSGLKGFERRDFKITAERWEKDSFLDVNGNVVTDIEWAISFDLLASVEMVHDEHFKNYKLAVPESIMAKAELSKNLSAQLKADAEKKAEREAQAQAEAIQRGAIINPEKKYHVISWKIGAPVDEKTDCGIWDGSGMAHFSEGFGGFTYSADGWLYFAQEAEDEITAEPDQETAQESNSEAQADDQESAPRLHKTSKRLEIAKAEIDKWNRMAESVKGTNSYALFSLWKDGIDHNGKWFALGNDHNIRAHMIPHPSDCYFIKKIKGNTWLYFEDCAGIQERWLLSDLAIAFFLPEPSQESSSDNSEEIIKETAEESTESKSEPIEASSAVEFAKISDYEIKASWNGETIGRISIHYKSYSPVIKIYRISGNMREKFDSLDDAKMHLIQNFRAKAQEALDQAEDEKIKLKIRNKIDALDDQIADLFIKGAEMRTGKEA